MTELLVRLDPEPTLTCQVHVPPLWHGLHECSTGVAWAAKQIIGRGSRRHYRMARNCREQQK
ncbi:MAG TPA: hypothetical protein VGR35_01510 [Tepidisphaeraceae bacterium]|nr:hypothetical protein [Tepidisphaeraceae bacterium]